MPFWSEARQKRVARRVALIKEAFRIISSLLQVGGLIAGGIGLVTFFLGIFLYWQVPWAMTAIIWGFICFFVGYMMDAFSGADKVSEVKKQDG